MADHTSIIWTDATWNVVTGCTKVSDGCSHCYIERTPPFRMGGRRFNGTRPGATTGVLLHPDRLDQPLRWRLPRRVFVCSLADLFHTAVPDAHIARVFATMALASRHTFQILTKRHDRLRSLLGDPGFRDQVAKAATGIIANDSRRHGDLTGWTPLHDLADRVWMPPWPLPNVWVGVSVEDQQSAQIRIPALLHTPAAVRWISAEPLLGPLDLAITDPGATAPGGLDWIVCGGESGPNARPMFPQWARGLRDQALDAHIPFLFKQWGEFLNLGMAIDLGLRPCGEIRAYPGALVKRVGTKAAGRLLDGQTWDEYPVPLVVAS